ncbi:MAG: hypothetical protein ACI9UQ_002093, partial [Candidatus Krumholzibacteriia bacterium]
MPSFKKHDRERAKMPEQYGIKLDVSAAEKFLSAGAVD